jgi:hypothetical protein
MRHRPYSTIPLGTLVVLALLLAPAHAQSPRAQAVSIPTGNGWKLLDQFCEDHRGETIVPALAPYCNNHALTSTLAAASATTIRELIASQPTPIRIVDACARVKTAAEPLVEAAKLHPNELNDARRAMKGCESSLLARQPIEIEFEALASATSMPAKALQIQHAKLDAALREANANLLESADDFSPQLASTSSTSGAIGGSLQSTILSGLASVFAERTKAELQLFAIGKLKELACTKARITWFPTTCSFLTKSAEDLPTDFGPSIRAALADDVTQLPATVTAHLPKSIDGTSTQLMAVLFAESAKLLLEKADVYEVAHQMVVLATPGPDAFQCNSPDPEARQECNRVAGAVSLSGNVLLAILNKGDLPSTDDALVKILEAAIRLYDPALTPTPAQLSALAGELRAARDHARKFVAATSHDARVAEIEPLVTAATSAVDGLLAIAGSGALARGDLSRMTIAAVTVFSTLPGIDLDNVALRIISFAAELVQAKTGNEASAAIEAVIAPPGAFRLKKTRPMVSLGGLVGVGTGYEWLHGARLPSNDGAASGYVGISALVGLDLSLPTGCEWAPDVGVFVSVLDIGSMFSFRFNDDPIQVVDTNGTTTKGKVSTTSEVKLAQVLAPGIYARVRLGGSPFVLSAGGSFVPHARRITTETSTLDDDSSAFRLSAMLSIDLTLLPIH